MAQRIVMASIYRNDTPRGIASNDSFFSVRHFIQFAQQAQVRLITCTNPLIDGLAQRRSLDRPWLKNSKGSAGIAPSSSPLSRESFEFNTSTLAQ